MSLISLAFVTSFWTSLGSSAIYVVAGVFLMALCFWLFDWLTPGNLHKEILENRNVAAGILAAGVMVAIGMVLHGSFQ